jgi:hypothetical protein
MSKRAFSLLAAFIGLVLLVVNCETPEHDNATPTNGVSTTSTEPSSPSAARGESPMPAGPTGATHRVTDLVGSPQKLIGKSVTVVANVEEVYGARAFKLTEEAPAATDHADGSSRNPDVPKNSDDGLLTLIPKVGSFPSADASWTGGKARVTGVVEEMEVKDIEREVGWELEPELKSKFKGKPVLVARSIERFKK